jgi:hypothetical protein
MQSISFVLKGVVEEYAIEPVDSPVVVSNITTGPVDVTL